MRSNVSPPPETEPRGRAPHQPQPKAILKHAAELHGEPSGSQGTSPTKADAGERNRDQRNNDQPMAGDVGSGPNR